MSLNDTSKTCLITGASSGIGYAIAKALKEDKYRIVVTARRKGKMNTLAGKNVDIVPGDLLSSEFIDSLVSHMYKKYGQCDYLFNCAGSITVGTIEEMDIEKMSAMLRLNIEATFRLTYMLLKKFKKQQFGHIINISSILGTKVRPTAGAYAASKFALEALSEALRIELSGTEIKVSCIEPGLVMTELHNDWKIHPRESMNILDPLSVKDIVDTVKFIMQQPDHVRIPRLMILPKDQNI
jgi:NADP-dependent 3-hydroxy acid dehydrogenase YdfG